MCPVVQFGTNATIRSVARQLWIALIPGTALSLPGAKEAPEAAVLGKDEGDGMPAQAPQTRGDGEAAAARDPPSGLPSGLCARETGKKARLSFGAGPEHFRPASAGVPARSGAPGKMRDKPAGERRLNSRRKDG